MSESEDQELPKTTLPNVKVSLRGFRTEDEAMKAWNLVGANLWMLGALMNLERLDGVTVAYDYDDALAQLDRGFQATCELARTRDEFALGIAMAPAVLRDGQVRAHMFLHGRVAEWLQDESNPAHRIAVYLLAHEAAHVEDLYFRDRAMPGVLLNHRLSHEKAVMFEIADACWSEYAACRRSAFADPEQGKDYEDTFCETLRGARERGNQHIRDYRLHGDTDLLLSHLVREYGGLAKYASYMLGHLAGEKRSLHDGGPRAYEAVEQTGYFGPLMPVLIGALEEMWNTRASWSGLAAYDRLTKFARELLRVAGVELSTRQGMLYMDVPFNEETMP